MDNTIVVLYSDEGDKLFRHTNADDTNIQLTHVDISDTDYHFSLF